MTADPPFDDARAVQRRLEELYELEAGPDVTDFVRPAGAGERETVVLRAGPDTLELAVLLPEATAAPTPLDHALQIIEGVSHFVYLAERARIELPATELELELQAEVDKFVLLAFDGERFPRGHAGSVHHALYSSIRFVHAEDTDRGRRYRIANDLAARFSRRLVDGRAGDGDALPRLQRFYRAGQTDKIRIASAA